MDGLGAAEASIIVASIALVGTVLNAVLGNRKQMSELILNVGNLMSDVKALTAEVKGLLCMSHDNDARLTLLSERIDSKADGLGRSLDECKRRVSELEKHNA